MSILSLWGALGRPTVESVPSHASLFSAGELGEFHDLDDLSSRQAGQIRGKVKTWSIRGEVLCGRHTRIDEDFNARGRVRIGKYCAFGRFVSLIGRNHRTDMPNQQVGLSHRFGFRIPGEVKGPVEIGHNVWIGDKVTVLSGAQVGHGCVLAAGATVTSSVGPFEIVGGTPATLIRKRFTEKVIEQMLGIAWWDWPDDRIERNREFFETVIPPDADIDLRAIVRD